MRKLYGLTAALALGLMLQSAVALASPTCVLMKFSDDTRYDKIESAATLSDMVMEKLLNSGKFSFKETKVVPQDIEDLLYSDRAAELRGARAAMSWGDYDALFEGDGFAENRAQSMASARLGQIVAPRITASLGKNHCAEYLIHGTIVNLGTGGWWDEGYGNALMVVNNLQNVAGTLGATNALGFLGPLGQIANMVGVVTTGIGVQTELSVIKASTGEVVWQKRVTAISKQKKVSLMGVKVAGSDKLNSNIYYKAMELAATKISDALIAEADTMFKK